jgi:hypothetical protein
MYKNKEGDQIPEEADGVLPSTKQPIAKIKKEDLPSTFFVVCWHVTDHAEGESFITLESADKFYQSKHGGDWAARLYDNAGK